MPKITRLSLDTAGEQPELPPSAETPSRPIGEELRAARHARNLDIADISKALKIRPEYLDAIETGDVERLPARVYALGFVRSYAAHVGLNPREIGDRYAAETAGRGSGPKLELEYPQDRRFPRGALFLGALLIVASAYGGYYLLVSVNRASQPVLAVPERFARAAEEPQGPQLEPIVPAAPAVPAEAAPAEDGAVPAAEAPQGAPDAAAEPPQAPVLPAGKLYGEDNAGSRITLRVHAPTKILVQGADNTVYINRTLTAGDLYQTPNVVGLTVSTPDSGAVEVILDGASLGYLGRRGAIAEGLSLNPQDLVDRSAQNRAG